MDYGHWKCQQKLRSVEHPMVGWDKESKYVIAEGSLGMRWAMGHCLKAELLSRIDMMRPMSLLRHVEMKCSHHSRWVALAILAMVKVLC